MLGFLQWACVVAAVVFALIWLLSVTAVIGSIVAWIAPSGLFAAALAIAIGAWQPPRPPAAS